MRKKKAIDYIDELRFSSDKQKSALGEKLVRQYETWTQSLQLKDLLSFLNCIQENKEKIGTAQFFGRFRASALEEFLYRLLKTKLELPSPLQIFWGEKCLIWMEKAQPYGVEVDITIGKRTKGFVEPLVAIDAKVELDAARLKTALASMLLIKRLNQETTCFLTYLRKEISDTLLNAVNTWIDGIFHFSLKQNQIASFLSAVQNATLRS
jgi:hypothetical protein